MNLPARQAATAILSDVMGSVVRREVIFTGNANFHYDEALAQETGHTPFKVTRWRELPGSAGRRAWQDVFAGW